MKEKLIQLVIDLRIAEKMDNGEEKTRLIEDFFNGVDELNLKRERGNIFSRNDRCNKGHCIHEFGYYNKTQGINIWVMIYSEQHTHKFIIFDSSFGEDE